MLLLDVEKKVWSKEMLEICGISESQMPALYESYQVVGAILPEISEKLGISPAAKVVAGAGDNAAAAVGTGVVGNGGCNISLGTSGTIFISSDSFGVDPNNALHAFAHADGGWHLMGCMLSAASCNKWLCEEILQTRDYAAEQSPITEEKLGRNRVYFLPYLMAMRDWIERKRSLPREDGFEGIFPSGVGSDWSERGQFWTFTDSHNCMALRSLCEALEICDSDEYEITREIYDDYSEVICDIRDLLYRQVEDSTGISKSTLIREHRNHS
jgi:hypothetical protein